MSNIITDLTNIAGTPEPSHSTGTNLVPGQNYMANSGCLVKRLVLIATGSYNNVVRRSYNITATQDDVNRLSTIVQNSTTNSIMEIAGVASDIIKPATQIDKEIGIVNGWDEPRFRFFLELIRPLGQGTAMRYCYSGFTDYVGATTSGAIDRNLRFHITNMCTIQDRNGSGYNRTISSVKRDHCVLVNERHYNNDPTDVAYNRNFNFNRRQQQEWVMDPHSAVLNHSGAMSLESMDISGGMSLPMYASVKANEARRISRGYNLPSYYLGRLINARRNAYNDSYDSLLSTDPNADMETLNTITSNTIGMLHEDRLDKDPLFALLMNESNVMQSASFHYDDLCNFFPELDKNSDALVEIVLPSSLGVVRMGNPSHHDLHDMIRNSSQNYRDTQQWTGATNETIIATSVSQQLPNIMVSQLIQSIHFSVTNRVYSTLDGNYQWVIGNHHFNSHDNRTAVTFLTNLPSDTELHMIEGLKTKVEKLILDSISFNGELDFSLTVDCDVTGECTIVVQTFNNPAETFIMPTFAGAMTAPIITSDVNHCNQFTQDIVTLIDNTMGHN